MSNHTDMKKIADIVGVSIATVSRTINSPESVRPLTRKKVLRAIEDHQYIYNSSAADLSRKKTTVIGVLIPDAQMPMFGSALVAIQDNLQEKNYSIMVGNTKYNSNIEVKLLKQFQQRNVAGIIKTGFDATQSTLEKSIKEWGIPCIVIFEKLQNPNISYVGFDNYKAAFSATQYLIELGHKRIGLIVGPYTKQMRIRKRVEGYKAALEESNIKFNPEISIETNVGLLEGKNAMSRLLSLPEPPTAIFAAADRLAIGALRAATEMGFCVPEDVSIIGYGDIDVAAFCNPPLTTVRTPNYSCARKATELIIGQIENNTNTIFHYCMETSLIIRDSCIQYK